MNRISHASTCAAEEMARTVLPLLETPIVKRRILNHGSEPVNGNGSDNGKTQRHIDVWFTFLDDLGNEFMIQAQCHVKRGNRGLWDSADIVIKFPNSDFERRFAVKIDPFGSYMAESV